MRINLFLILSTPFEIISIYKGDYINLIAYEEIIIAYEG
jgi:hypothetical protein